MDILDAMRRWWRKNDTSPTELSGKEKREIEEIQVMFLSGNKQEAVDRLQRLAFANRELVLSREYLDLCIGPIGEFIADPDGWQPKAKGGKNHE